MIIVQQSYKDLLRSAKLSSDLQFFWLGRVSYHEATKLQHHLHQVIKESQSPGVVLFLEHDPVITLGKNVSDDSINAQVGHVPHVPIMRTERGGQATAHMPGQLICYPLLRLGEKLGPKKYVFFLEEAVIRYLATLNIEAFRDSKYPGVWVSGSPFSKKICALGIRVKEHISLHGFALNVEPDLSLFDFFSPCGITDRGVTSIAREVDLQIFNVPQLSKVASQLAEHLMSLKSFF